MTSSTAILPLAQAGAVEPTTDILAEHVAEIRALGKHVITDIIEIGRRLTACKDIVNHGDWSGWLKQNFGWSSSTALNFMHVFEMAKSANFADLSLPVSALYLLARPSTPPAARDEIIGRATNGEALTLTDVKEAIEEVKSPAQAEEPPPSDDTDDQDDHADQDDQDDHADQDDQDDRADQDDQDDQDQDDQDQDDQDQDDQTEEAPPPRSSPRKRQSRFDADNYSDVFAREFDQLLMKLDDRPTQFEQILDCLRSDVQFINNLAELTRHPKVVAVLAAVATKLGAGTGGTEREFEIKYIGALSEIDELKTRIKELKERIAELDRTDAESTLLKWKAANDDARVQIFKYEGADGIVRLLTKTKALFTELQNRLARQIALKGKLDKEKRPTAKKSSKKKGRR